MPPVRRPPLFSSTERRKRLADKISATGFPAMAPCPQCQSQPGAVCMVRKGYKSCSSCLRKNITCGGSFSDAEFDALESQKEELRRQHREERERLVALAHQLLASQRAQERIEQKLERVTARQSELVDQEARLLGELDEVAPGSVDPEPPVALMSTADFSWDDPEVLAMMQDSGGIPEHLLGGSSSKACLAPVCIP